MPRRTAAIALFAAACGAQDLTITGGLPDDVYVATLVYSDNGTVTGGSGLKRYRTGDPLRLEVQAAGDPERIVVYAFAPSTIDSLPTRPSDEQLARDPIFVASPQESRLPDPVWIGEGLQTKGVVSLGTLDSAPAVRTAWLPVSRLLLMPGEVGVVDEACRPIPCGTTATQQGSELDIRVALCTGGRLTGQVDGSGSLEFNPSVQFGTCSNRETRAGARASFSCTGGLFEGQECALDVYGAPPELPFDVRVVETGDGAYLEEASGLSLRHTDGLVLLDDRVAVSRFSSPQFNCANAPTTLTFYERDTLEVIDAIPAPPCLRKLRAIPGEDAFVGLIRDQGPAIARFDRAGNITHTSSITLSPGTYEADVAVDVVGARVVVMTGVGVGGAIGDAQSFDLATLERSTTEVLGSAPRSIAVLPNGGFAVSDDEDNQVFVVRDVGTDVLNVRPGCGRGSQFTIRHHRGTDRLLVSARDALQALLIVDPLGASGCRRIKQFEVEAEPLAVADWPLDPDLAVIGFDGAAQSDNDRAVIAFADIVAGRMRQGTIDVGRGPINELAVDERGYIYALLSWSDRLALVTPR